MVMRSGGPRGTAGGDATGHAEMEQQQTVRIELDQDVLATAAERADQRAVQSRSKGWWERPPQIGPAQLRPQDPASADPQRQAAPDSLDLRQLGHRSHNYRTPRIGAPRRARRQRAIFLPDGRGLDKRGC